MCIHELCITLSMRSTRLKVLTTASCYECVSKCQSCLGPGCWELQRHPSGAVGQGLGPVPLPQPGAEQHQAPPWGWDGLRLGHHVGLWVSWLSRAHARAEQDCGELEAGPAAVS